MSAPKKFYIIAEYQGGYNKTIVLSTLQVLSTTTLVISILGDAQSGIHSSTCGLEHMHNKGNSS